MVILRCVLLLRACDSTMFTSNVYYLSCLSYMAAGDIPARVGSTLFSISKEFKGNIFLFTIVGCDPSSKNLHQSEQTLHLGRQT